MRWPLALLALWGTGCFISPGTLELSRERLDVGLSASLRRVEVLVASGSAKDGGAVTCEDLLDGSRSLDDENLRVFYRESFELPGEVPPPVGRLPEGRVLFLARAFDGACSLVADGCSEPDIVSGEGGTVSVLLEALASPERCGADRACVLGECRACAVDSECDDGNACTFDDCDTGSCSHTPGYSDLDGDGHGAASCGCGADCDDCDDSDDEVFPGAPRRCGRGVDHDCDGIVDDTQGCGTCSGATGLTFRETASIAAPAVGVSTLGPAPDGDGSQELFVGTPSQLLVFSVPAGGVPTLLGVSPFPGVTPSSPVVVGEWLLVADVEGDGGIMLFSIEDLRAGDAVPRTTVGESLGVVAAFTADARILYANVGSVTAPALATASVTSLPDLAQPEVILASGEWGNCRALARDGTPEGGWLVGSLGQSASWARLGPTGDIVDAGNVRITEGFGNDVALSAGRVLLAQGDRGLMVIDLDRFSSSDGCCTLADLTSLSVPVGCSGADCRNGVAVAVASDDRAVLMGFSNSDPQKVVLYLIDTTDEASMSVVAEAPLSNAGATGRDLFVSGNVIFAASRVGMTTEGAVDIFDLTCP